MICACCRANGRQKPQAMNVEAKGKKAVYQEGRIKHTLLSKGFDHDFLSLFPVQEGNYSSRFRQKKL
jgi:hypothetical protein